MVIKPLKSAVVIILFMLAGVLFGHLFQAYWPSLKNSFLTQQELYLTPNTELQSRFSQMVVKPLGWRDLLPEEEEAYLSQYQAKYQQNKKVESLVDQVLLSIQASTDKAYMSTLSSTNIVEDLLEQAISISGFIVPIDLNEDRTLKSFFVVPYYGACIHFPPPPPNQMVYVQLPDGFAHHNLNDAFTLTGILKKGLFEDPLGTSAYMLEVTSIIAYYGQPDDVRTH